MMRRFWKTVALERRADGASGREAREMRRDGEGADQLAGGQGSTRSCSTSGCSRLPEEFRSSCRRSAFLSRSSSPRSGRTRLRSSSPTPFPWSVCVHWQKQLRADRTRCTDLDYVKGAGWASRRAGPEGCRRGLAEIPRHRHSLVRLIFSARLVSKLICHNLFSFHEDYPPQLVKLQDEHWKPLLAWVSSTFNVQVKTYEGILGNKQADDTSLKLGAVVEGYDQFRLAGAPLSSSLSHI